MSSFELYGFESVVHTTRTTNYNKPWQPLRPIFAFNATSLLNKRTDVILYMDLSCSRPYDYAAHANNSCRMSKIEAVNFIMELVLHLVLAYFFLL